VKQEKARADEFVYDVYVEDKEKQVRAFSGHLIPWVDQRLR
jgi:hypothetical protein